MTRSKDWHALRLREMISILELGMRGSIIADILIKYPWSASARVQRSVRVEF